MWEIPPRGIFMQHMRFLFFMLDVNIYKENRKHWGQMPASKFFWWKCKSLSTVNNKTNQNKLWFWEMKFSKNFRKNSMFKSVYKNIERGIDLPDTEHCVHCFFLFCMFVIKTARHPTFMKWFSFQMKRNYCISSRETDWNKM